VGKICVAIAWQKDYNHNPLRLRPILKEKKIGGAPGQKDSVALGAQSLRHYWLEPAVL